MPKMSKDRFFLLLCLMGSLISCLQRSHPKNPLDGKVEQSSASVNNEKFPLVKIDSQAQGFYLTVCNNEDKTCINDLVTDPVYSPQGLKPGNYTADIYECQSDKQSYSCKNKIKTETIQQGNYSNPLAQSLISTDFDLQVRQKTFAYALYGALSQHRQDINLCLQNKSLDPDSIYQKYKTQLDVFFDQDPITAINGLAKAYQQDQALSIPTGQQKPAGTLGLVDDFTYGHLQIRVSMINHQVPPADVLQIFEPGTWKINFAGLYTYFFPASASHSSLLMEQWNNRTKKWTTLYYISWPSGDNLDEDLRNTYLNRERVRIELPPISQKDFLRFQKWYKEQPYSATPYGRAEQMAADRLAKKREITTLGIPEAEMRTLTMSNATNKRMLKDALNRRRRIQNIRENLRSPGLAPSEIQRLTTELDGLRPLDQRWYVTWPPFVRQQALLDANPDFQTRMSEYLDLEVQADRLRKWETGEKEAILARKNQNAGYLKSLLGIPAHFDLESIAFDPDRFWMLVPPKEIFDRYDRTSRDRKARGLRGWPDHVRANFPQIQRTLLSLPRTYYPEAWRPIIEGMTNEVEFLDRFETFEQFDRVFLPDVFDEYHRADYELYRKADKYSSGYDLKWKNCSRAVSDSLSVLYQKPFMRRTDIFMNPGLLQERVQEYTDQYRKTLSPEPSSVSKSTIASIALGVATITASAVVLKSGALNLTSSDEEDEIAQCFEKAQEKFYDDSDPIFIRFQEANYVQNLMRYLGNNPNQGGSP